MLPEAARYKKEWQAAQQSRLDSGVETDSFVYLHLNADNGVPHYVGIGYKKGRPWGLNRNKKHHNKVSKHGLRVEIVADNLTWEQACFWEVRWIKALRDSGYELTNLTDGGEGTKGFRPSEETKEKMRGPRPILSEQKQGHWTGDNNPNKKQENKTKISKRMTINNPMHDPGVVARVSASHPRNFDGYVNPNKGRPNKGSSIYMTNNNPMFKPDVVDRVKKSRKENGNGWEGDKNPSSKMTKEQLSARGKKSAATRKLKGKSSALLYMAWEYKNVRPHFYWGA